MLDGSVTVSGDDRFRLFASNVTQMVVILGWYGPYGSMRPRGHVRHLAFGDRGQPSAQWV